MGQKAAKAEAKSSAPSADADAGAFPFADLDAALNDDESRARLKAWAKKKSDGALHNSLLAYEAIGKRRAVFTSGKRCGDSDAALSDKMVKLGETLVEKHLAEDAEAPVCSLDAQLLAAVRAADLAQLDVFDGVAAALKQYVEKA